MSSPGTSQPFRGSPHLLWGDWAGSCPGHVQRCLQSGVWTQWGPRQTPRPLPRVCRVLCALPCGHSPQWSCLGPGSSRVWSQCVSHWPFPGPVPVVRASGWKLSPDFAAFLKWCGWRRWSPGAGSHLLSKWERACGTAGPVRASPGSDWTLGKKGTQEAADSGTGATPSPQSSFGECTGFGLGVLELVVSVTPSLFTQNPS